MNYFSTRRITTWVIILLILLNLSTLAMLWVSHFKQPPLPLPQRDDRNIEQFLQQELGLTDKQARQFEELRQEHFQQSKPIVEAMQQLKRELLEVVFASAPELETMQTIAAKIGIMQTELETLRYRHFLELKSLCQPEQVQKFRALFHEIYPPETHPAPGPPPQLGQQRPPPEALAACQNRSQGSSCHFTGPRESVVGICQRVNNQLVCVPTNRLSEF